METTPRSIPSDPDKKVYDLTDVIFKGHWHEVQVFAVNGMPYQFTAREWLDVLLSKRFLLAIVVVVCALVLVKPEEFESDFPFWFRTVLWGGVICLYAVLTYIVGNAIIGLFNVLRIRVFPTIIMHALVLPILTYLGYFLASIYAGNPEIMDALSIFDILRNLFFVLMFEAYVASFIGPQVVGKHSGEGTENIGRAKGDPNKVAIGGSLYDPRTLLFVQSAGHYLEIHFSDRSEFVRMSMANLTRQIRKEDGIQPHRSYWVSKSAVSGFERKNGRGFVLLTDGTEIPISRGRSKAVKEWVEGLKKTPGH